MWIAGTELKWSDLLGGPFPQEAILSGPIAAAYLQRDLTLGLMTWL